MSFSVVNHNFTIESTLFNLEDNSTVDLSNSIIDVMVRKRFLEESFPLVVLDLKTTESIRNMIRDNDCKIHIKVMYYDTDNGNTDDTDDVSIAPEGISFEANIRIYEKPYSTTTAKKDIDSSESDNTQSESAPFIYYRVHGIPEESISKNEGTVNNVFKDAEPIDALIYLLSSVGSVNPRLQESDNKEKYKNIIVPPISVVPAVKMIQNYYHIYNDGLSLFFDTDATYCFSPFSPNKPQDNLFEINVISTTATAELKTAQKPTIDKQTNNIRVSIQSLPAFTRNTKVARHTTGSETIYYTYDETFNLSQRTTNDDKSFNKVRYIWNEMTDKSFEDEYSNAFKRNHSMTIAISNLNPAIITPYTNVRVIASDYPEAEGDYFISDISYVIETTDLKHYTGSSSLLLIKK